MDWVRFRKREYPVCVGVCVSVNKFRFVHINHDSVVMKKISTEDWLLYVGDNENPG